jgi:hypothetical protein
MLDNYFLLTIIKTSRKKSMFERENDFYTSHQTEFQKEYLNKWLVIAGESLWV